MRKPPNGGEFFTLESCIIGEGSLNLKDVDLDSTNREFHDFFNEAQVSSAKKVHQQKLEVVCGTQDEVASGQVSLWCHHVKLLYDTMQSCFNVFKFFPFWVVVWCGSS
jgi:hypothetical protein